jgi:hypothetical protein
VSLRLTSEWRVGRFDVVASGAFTCVGPPLIADRILIAGSDGTTAIAEPLRLPHRVEIGAGVRRSLSRRLAVVAETVATLEVSGRTRTLDAAPPLDLILGLQTRIAGARLTAGLLRHGRSLRTGDVHAAPLAGLVDLSRASELDARQYLRSGGLESAASYLRPGIQWVVPVLPGVAMPPGARVIPNTYTIRSEHQTGLVLSLGWVF